jgi:thiol-disulfide isomerase/thioredoxin
MNAKQTNFTRKNFRNHGAHFVLFVAMVFNSFAFLHAYSPADRFQLVEQGKLINAPIYDLNGGKKMLSHLKGKYTLITFWATWCRACVSEMPYLEKLAQQFKHDPINFVTITRSYPSQTTETVKTFRQKNGLMSLDFYEDSDGKDSRAQIHKSLGVNSLPSAVLVDPKGQIVGRLDGAVQWNHKDFIKLFQDILDGKVKPSNPRAQNSGWWSSLSSFFRL